MTVDFVATAGCWPDKGVKTKLDSLTICDGGLVGTALVATARLGGKDAFVGKLGHSEMARRALEALRRESVDTFHGAFALAVARDQSVVSAARFALGAAALCATQLGGRAGIPTAQQLEQFLSKHES